MSENNEGVVMSQADNRYNLILLGSHLSHPQSGNSSCQTFICILSFHFLFALHCSVNKKIYQQEIEFSTEALGQFTVTMMVRSCGYNLVINESFYGEYGCQAVNELGVASKSLQVSGEENVCFIILCRKHNNILRNV